MSELSIFCRQVRNRSLEHQAAMKLLGEAGLIGQMAAILRQELDSMVRVIYLLAQSEVRRAQLLSLSVNGERWHQQQSKAAVTDRQMVELATHLQGWTNSVYKFGCAFIHLSSMHDYNDRDPLINLPSKEREDIIAHCRHYHGGPCADRTTFTDLVPYLPRVMEKIASNLECYVKSLESGQPADIAL